MLAMADFLQAKAPIPTDASPANCDNFITAQGCDHGWISSRRERPDGSGNAKPRRSQEEASRFSFFAEMTGDVRAFLLVLPIISFLKRSSLSAGKPV